MCSTSSATSSVSNALSEKAERLKAQGNECFKEKRFYKAIEFYSQAVDEQPHSVILSNRAQAFLNIHRAEEAYSDANEAFLRDPTNLKALYRRALALNKLGLKSKAFVDLQKCVNLDPKNREAAELLKIVKNQQDKGVVDVACFQKSEGVQSKKPLKTLKIFSKSRQNQIAPSPVSTSRVEGAGTNLSQGEEAAAANFGELAMSSSTNAISRLSVNDVHIDDKMELTEEDANFANLPPPARSFAYFLGAWTELCSDPLKFASYFLTLDLVDFGALFDEVADLDILPTLIHGLFVSNFSANISKKALSALIRFAQTTRFPICVAFLGDSSRRELCSYLTRFNCTNSQAINDIRQLYQLSDDDT